MPKSASLSSAAARKSSIKRAHMVKRNMKNSVTLWSISLRIFTFGFFLCFRTSLEANLDADRFASSPTSSADCFFIKALTFSSCGSLSWLRGVHISSSRPVH